MERRGSKAERRGAEAVQGTNDQGAHVAARGGFASWLREQRELRGQSIEDVARITRIQQRTLERLEDGRFEELPADVFVRGFIRNYARCVGIDADEALARYGDCGVAPAPVASIEAQALLETMAALAPQAASSAAVSTVGTPRVLRARASTVQAAVEPPPVVEIPDATPPELPAVEPMSATPIAAEPAPVVAAEPPASASASTSAKRRRGRRVAEGTGAPSADEGAEVASASPKSKRRRRNKKKDAAQAPSASTAAIETNATPDPATPLAAPVEPESLDVEIEIVATPAPAPIRVAPVVAARVSRRVPTVAAPTLVIDDDDPDSAERAREAREAANEAREPSRRSFLPPILLDEERSGRQGGLTLAVIILLIVATLTLSYLMRRPGSSSEGVTAREIPHLVA